MRIAHIICYLAPSDGHAAFCRQLAASHAQAGHRCTILCGTSSQDLSPPPSGVEVQALAPVSRPLPFAPPALRHALMNALRASGAQIAHLHGFWPPFVRAGLAAAAAAGIPALLSPHGALSPRVLRHRRQAKRLLWLACRRRFLHNVAALHAASPDEADHIRAMGFRQRIAVVPIGVELPAIPPFPATDPGRTRRLLFLSRLHPVKGLPNLLQAWAAVRPAGWQLDIAGPDTDNQQAALAALAERLGVSSSLRFIGEVRDAARDACYREADLFVLPSRTENFGMVVAEALAHALPVITTTGTPWRELVSHDCGWWVDPDAVPLAAALRAAVALSDGERQAMGLRGRQLIEQQYRWQPTADALAAWYAALAAGLPAPPEDETRSPPV